MKPKKPKLPNGLNDPARDERDRFLDALAALEAEVSRVSLTILIWGPSPESPSPVAIKRSEIREALKGLGHNALFPEDLPTQGGNARGGINLYELWQAETAHLIFILLEDAPSAVAELHDFWREDNIASKLFVMIPEALQNTYIGEGGVVGILDDGRGAVYWYKQADFDQSNLCKKAVARAEARRREEYLKNRRKYAPC